MTLSERVKLSISEAVNTRHASWRERQEDVPSILYHYTSAEGLISILRSMGMWATDVRYMNDLSELQYARGLVGDRLAYRSGHSQLDPIEVECVRRMKNTFDPFKFARSVFAVSFCEKGNLLSQWRAYRGKGGGYAIGYDCFHLLRFLSRECVLRKVIYDVGQQRELVDNTIDVVLSCVSAVSAGQTLVDVGEEFLRTVDKAFSSAIGEFVFTFKHPDFSEEREWRLVHFANVDRFVERSAEAPQFRSQDGNVVPYFVIGFERAVAASRDDTYGVPFPIAELVIGPTIDADLNEDSTKTLLLSLNADIAPIIRRSAIPLRSL